MKSWQRIVNCTYCGKEFITTKYKLEQNNDHHIFCSHKCYSEFRKEYYIKDRASVYKKIKVLCNNCGKEFLVPPSRLKNKNKDGENHLFCCYKCYYEFRSKYYVGTKLYNTGRKMSDEFRDKIRSNTLKQYTDGILDRQTKPQKIINSMLDELGVKYTNEKTFGYYSVDNYLDNDNLIIEVMGDYFHANPNKYKEEVLNDMQKKDIVRDQRKHTYIKKYHSIEILYLWENEINKKPNLCKKLIQDYIENNGKLDDYNSFNFFINDNKLKLNKQIINPYFIKNP